MQLSTRPRRYKAVVGSQNTAAASLESHCGDAGLIEASAAGKRNPQRAVKGPSKVAKNVLTTHFLSITYFKFHCAIGQYSDMDRQ